MNHENSLDKLVDDAVDLMGSQQAMRDDGSLQMLAGIVRQAYELGKQPEENTWTVLGIWENDEAVPIGAVRGTHKIYGEPPDERAREKILSRGEEFYGFNTASFYEQGTWVCIVTAPDADTAQDLAVAEMTVNVDDDLDEEMK